MLYAQGLTPSEARHTSLRDALQIVRGHHMRERQRMKGHAQLHSERMKTDARHWAQLYSMLSGLAGEKKHPNDFLPKSLRTNRGGMTKERLRKNYEVEMQRQKERS